MESLIKPSAVCFDLDGTLVNTEDIFFQTANHLLANQGLPLYTEAEFGHDFGNGQFIPGIAQRLHVAIADLDDFRAQFHQSMDFTPLRLKPGALDLLYLLSEHAIPICLVSNSSRSWVMQQILPPETAEFFSHIVTGNDVAHPKPAPDLYIQALKLLNQYHFNHQQTKAVLPHQVLAVEDSPSGLEAASSAGLTAVFVPNRFLAPQHNISNCPTFPSLIAFRDALWL
ncbi:MAG: HAD family phosphatase [Methanothrix sp.]